MCKCMYVCTCMCVGVCVYMYTCEYTICVDTHVHAYAHESANVCERMCVCGGQKLMEVVLFSTLCSEPGSFTAHEGYQSASLAVSQALGILLPSFSALGLETAPMAGFLHCAEDPAQAHDLEHRVLG